MRDRMKCVTLSLLVIVWMGFALPVAACEPIIPLAQLFSGAIATTGSLLILLGAITLKALAFSIFEERLPWYNAFLVMVLANIFSTCIGVALSVSAAVPTLFVIALPLVYILSFTPATRLVRYHPGGYLMGWNAHVIASIVTGLFIGTWGLFGLAQSIIAANEPLVLYWVLKFLYVYSALVISIGLTTVWEEWVVARSVHQTLGGASCYSSVLKANLVTSFAIFGYAAIMMLPDRVRSSDFLVQLFMK